MKREKFLNPTEVYGLLKTSVKYQTKEFFNNSTLHGVRYIAEKGRAFGEKFMWFCFVSIGVVAAFVIIGSLWEKFQTNPTITGLDTDFHNQIVYFPGVTICPVDSFNANLLNETAFKEDEGKEGDNVEEMIPVLKSLPKLTYDSFGMANEAWKNVSSNSDVKTVESLRQLTFKYGIACEDLLELCKYKDEDISCCDYFMPIYTEHGFCYSFNSRYYGTPGEEVRNDRINDLFETDKKWALSVVPTQSANVFVHSEAEVTSHDFRPTFFFDIGFSIELLITMKQTYTTDDARQLTIEQRKCIFANEVRLKYYKDDEYSFSACMKQCRMEKANKLCKCIPPFHMPATGSYRQCGLSDLFCLHEHRFNITDIRNCRQCELSCFNTVYDIEKFTRVVVPETGERKDYKIQIEFLTWPIIRYKREVLFGWIDLLVSFGGIAGLFLGFSLLSAVEIAYYFTLRTGCMIYKNKDELYDVQKQEKSGSITQYDLGLRPKLRKSDKMKSLSMPNVQIVKPVESAGSSKAIQVKAFDSPKVPIKKKVDGQIYTIKRIDDLVAIANRLDVRNTGRKKQFVPPRQNLFRPILVAPYSQNIKPLDRRFRFRSHSEGPENVMFDGYLP